MLAANTPRPASPIASDVEILDLAYLEFPGIHVTDKGACLKFDFYLNGEGAAIYLVEKKDDGIKVSSLQWRHRLRHRYYRNWIVCCVCMP